jgi:hypothetical protein
VPWTERTALDALHRRYTQFAGNADRWARAEHVRNGLGFMGYDDTTGRSTAPLRTIDFLALDLWESHGCAMIGHEVKVSRSDWLRELADPTKGEAWARWCDQFYVVAPMGVVRDRAELPAGWGLILLPALRDGYAIPAPRILYRATKRTPDPLPRALSFAIARSVHNTTARKATP